MDRKRLATLVLAAVTVVAWLALEVWDLFAGGPSISSQIYDLAHAYLPAGALISLVIGALWAHFFWQAGPSDKP
jgi:hypothetical protein